MRRENLSALDDAAQAPGHKKIKAAGDRRSAHDEAARGVVASGVVSGGTMTTTAAAGFTQRGASLLVLATLTMAPTIAAADEGGVSFWVPGFFGSLAATPQTPGFSFATHLLPHVGQGRRRCRVCAPGLARQHHRPFTGNVDINLKAKADLAMASELRLHRQVLGGQASVALLVPFGRTSRTSTGRSPARSARSASRCPAAEATR